MALPAPPRPDMPGPQPIETKTVTSIQATQAPLLLRASGGEVQDRLFSTAMTLCGLAVLGVLVLIVFELMLRSSLSWHAFGFKFFSGSDWDPVNEQFGALPLDRKSVV